MHTKPKSSVFASGAIAVAILGVFLLDILTPLGMATWALYALPIGWVYARMTTRSIALATGVVTVLILVAFYLSPLQVEPRLALLNRALGASLLWFTAGVLIRQRLVNESLARLTRMYAALGQVNQSIVMESTRETLLQRVCENLVTFGGFRMAWIGWHDAETRQLLPVAVAGDTHGYVRGIRVYADERPEGCGPTGRAFRSGQTFVCNDMLTNPITGPWRGELLRNGFKSSAVFPIRMQNETCAVLNVYAEEADFFHDKEVALLEEAAIDVSFALDKLALEAAHAQAEETLRSEKRFSDTMIESMPGVLYFYDNAGRFLRWNRNFGVVTGYTDEEIAGMHPRDFFRADEQPRIEDRIAEVFARGESSVEADFRSKDGSEHPYFFTGKRVRFEGKDCLVGVGIDLSARRRAESRLLESEARYRTLFEYAPDGIVIATPESIYLDANASICRMLGYTRGELIGMHASEIVAMEELPQIVPTLEALRHQNDHHREWSFRRKDGSVFSADVIATLMPDGNVLGMIRDISERKMAEAEREMRQQAEAADRIKSAFLATMSHELRTPLNSILGFTGLILQGMAGPLNDEQGKQLEMVNSSARHLLALVNDVLDISKIEAGQLVVGSAPFDVQTCLDRVIALVTPLATRKRLRLLVEMAPDLGEAVNDERRFQQILLNLLNNAIKFTDRGEVKLTARRLPEGDCGAEVVRVAISDTGIGIKPEYLRTIFQPFLQIDSGLSRNHDGTGLGLAICQRLADLMGGSIEASSVFGEGSTFSLILPVQRPPRS